MWVDGEPIGPSFVYSGCSNARRRPPTRSAAYSARSTVTSETCPRCRESFRTTPQSQRALMDATGPGQNLRIQGIALREPDSGTNNIHDANSTHWKRWLRQEHRCLVPFTNRRMQSGGVPRKFQAAKEIGTD